MQQVVSSVSSVYSPGAISGDGSLPAVPLFPVGVLPGACRQLVEEGVAALGVPPEFIAVPLLTFAGAAIGNAQCIQLKQGFEQRPVIYAAVVGPPGCGKSPADDLARRPLERYWLQCSASCFQLTTVNHSVSSRRSPLSVV